MSKRRQAAAARPLLRAAALALSLAAAGAAAAGDTDLAALGRPEFAPGTGFCAADQAAGVRGKLCRTLSGLLVRMEPLPDEGAALKLGRDSGVYYDGELVTVTVEVPPEMPSGYLNVVYLDESGDVLHMLPNVYAKQTAVRGGERVRIGVEDEGQRRRGLRDYKVAPPFGRGMILAVLSPRPLDQLGRRETETMGSFLSALETALRASSSRGTPVRFASTAIETRDR